jgi:hypothetical protein
MLKAPTVHTTFLVKRTFFIFHYRKSLIILNIPFHRFVTEHASFRFRQQPAANGAPTRSSLLSLLPEHASSIEYPKRLRLDLTYVFPNLHGYR